MIKLLTMSQWHPFTTHFHTVSYINAALCRKCVTSLNNPLQRRLRLNRSKCPSSALDSLSIWSFIDRANLSIKFDLASCLFPNLRRWSSMSSFLLMYLNMWSSSIPGDLLANRSKWSSGFLANRNIMFWSALSVPLLAYKHVFKVCWLCVPQQVIITARTFGKS